MGLFEFTEVFFRLIAYCVINLSFLALSNIYSEISIIVVINQFGDQSHLFISFVRPEVPLLLLSNCDCSISCHLSNFFWKQGSHLAMYKATNPGLRVRRKLAKRWPAYIKPVLYSKDAQLKKNLENITCLSSSFVLSK